jgi:hypothetical protein
MKKIALFLLAVVTLFTACNGPVANVSITVKPATMQLKVGETKRISVSVEPATEVEFEWKSLNESVATVDNKGIVTGVAVGETTIEVNVKGSDDVKTVSVAVIGELDNVSYYGVYPMEAKGDPYRLKDQDGNEENYCVYSFLMVPSNFYVANGRFAGSWDYPIFFDTPVSVDEEGRIGVFGATISLLGADNAFLPAENPGEEDLMIPYCVLTDGFSQDNYEKMYYQYLYLGDESEDLYSRYPYYADYSSIMYYMSMDDGGQYDAGYPTGEGIIQFGETTDESGYFLTIAHYDFKVKLFGNINSLGFELTPALDENGDQMVNEEGEELYYPATREGEEACKMAPMSEHHFTFGEPVQAQAPRMAESSIFNKMSDVNRMMFKAITYKKDIANMVRK